ncbi:aminoglycoside phosphotransferase family protein [Aliiroseovarius sp. PTFE2010]|uniref:aminoglycoside phosphotransferase family protein n=1 Tax=Aliiroseovarius sp. PTFE2010 TaxID=3417190 RepID=UPI003CF8EE81
MTKRAGDISDFLASAGWLDAERQPLAGDASARRYERLSSETGQAVLMDANPAKGESVGAFIDMTNHLRALGFSAPRIFAAQQEHGLLLIEDLGDDLFARHVKVDPADERLLYIAATDVLIELHQSTPPTFVQDYLPQMCPLASLAYEWYARGISGQKPQQEAFESEMQAALDRISKTSKVLILRDYHAENLLWLPARRGTARVGLLDYQDAMSGPRAYDLVSLIKDARRDVSPSVASDCADRYQRATGLDPAAFEYEMAVCSAQRNLRILGVFARLSLRDGKPGYLKWMSRVWRHLMDDLSHPDLGALKSIVVSDLPMPTQRAVAKLERV